MNNRQRRITERQIARYKNMGYAEDAKFPGEYTLLTKGPLTRVRVYENGHVAKLNERGVYVNENYR